MPITLGCPSCGKRFRARDESAGKRVKCPYCSAPVSVPTSAESAVAAAPTDALPKTPAVPAPAPGRQVPAQSGEASLPNPFGSDATGGSPFPSGTRSAPRQAPAPAKAAAPRPFGAAAAGAERPEEAAARAWRKARRGLGWVLFGLFFLAVPAFAEFGKEVYARTQGGLPEGSGGDWLKVEGYINSGDKSIKLEKVDIIDVGCYGIPLVLAGLFLFLGRLRAGAAPRNSGAKGLFAFSGLFTLVAIIGLWAYLICARVPDKQTDFPAKLVADYGALAFLICGLAAEFWFLTGLTAVGSLLKRPKVPRAVGLLGFIVALAVAIRYVGWDIYVRELRPNINPLDLPFYESMALMIGWLLVVGVYWRAVSSTRTAIRDQLDTLGE